MVSKKKGIDSAAQAGSNLEERRVSRQVETLRGIPPDQEVRRKKQKLGVHRVKRKEWRQSAAVDRKLESTENGVEGVKAERTQARGVSLQTWTRRTTSLEEEVCISCAQAALSANNTWSADAVASLQHLQKASEGLSVETLGVHVLYAVAARASPLGDLVREVLRTSFTIVKASGNFVRQRDLLPLHVPWSWAPFAEALWHAVDERRHRSSHWDRRRRRELHGVGCWSLLAICVLKFLYSGLGHLHELRVCREKARPAQLAAIRRIVRDARWLVERAPEDGVAQTTTQNFTQVLKHKRVGYTGEEISRPEPLSLLEIIPGLPPAGAVGIVDPLTLATGDVREAFFDPSLVLLPEAERVGVRPAREHATDEEWTKIGMELLQRGVVVEIAREDAPIVGGQPVLVGASRFEKRGTPIPPATRVLRLIVNAIPSNKQQTAIKGDIEQMPVGSEWLHIALETDEIVLWSSDDIQGCFHVFSLPPAWRKWMILSKPIPVAMPAGGAGVLTTNDKLSRGGNAPQPVGSDSSRLIWLALAVIPMGWLSAVGVIQHLHRNIISSGQRHHGGLDPDAELVRGKPFPVTLESFTRWWWNVYVDNFDIGEILGQTVAVEVIHTESLSQASFDTVAAFFSCHSWSALLSSLLHLDDVRNSRESPSLTLLADSDSRSPLRR